MRYVREDDGPWFRQPWPWLLMIPPVSAVILGALLLRMATLEPDGLVVADYYQEGRAINEVLERERFAAELGLAGDLWRDGEDLVLRMEGPALPPRPLVLRLMHPTRADKDMALILTRDAAPGQWRGRLAILPAARWHLHLEPEDRRWRLRGRMEPDLATVRMTAGD